MKFQSKELPPHKFSPPHEEVANTISHGIGIPLSLVALYYLLAEVSKADPALLPSPTAAKVGCVIFGLSLTFMYLMSTLYHIFQPGPKKYFFKQLDHMAIFVLIAGSYSVFCLSIFYSQIGIQMFWLLWALAAVGIGMELIWGRGIHKYSLILYLLMGWVSMSQYDKILTTFDTQSLTLLMAGGVSYTIGFIFYMMKKMPWSHLIWHIFVLGGSVCHVFCALYSFRIIPQS